MDLNNILLFTDYHSIMQSIWFITYIISVKIQSTCNDFNYLDCIQCPPWQLNFPVLRHQHLHGMPTLCWRRKLSSIYLVSVWALSTIVYLGNNLLFRLPYNPCKTSMIRTKPTISVDNLVVTRITVSLVKLIMQQSSVKLRDDKNDALIAGVCS